MRGEGLWRKDMVSLGRRSSSSRMAPRPGTRSLSTWIERRASGGGALLVASDDAVVLALRESVQAAGGRPDDVVEARRLAGRLSGRIVAESQASNVEPQIVVLGPLPSGVGDVPAAGCVQVAIVPFQASGTERLGRAAEVARPRHLVSELGSVRSSPSDRSAWRAGATAIETFRRRWSIDDPEHAFGDRSAVLARGRRRRRRPGRDEAQGPGRGAGSRPRDAGEGAPHTGGAGPVTRCNARALKAGSRRSTSRRRAAVRETSPPARAAHSAGGEGRRGRAGGNRQPVSVA